jgi:hypothetical protein
MVKERNEEMYNICETIILIKVYEVILHAKNLTKLKE